MNMINGMKIFGALLLILGALSFFVGLISWNKFWMATGFMAGIIAGALLYYVWYQDRPPESR